MVPAILLGTLVSTLFEKLLCLVCSSLWVARIVVGITAFVWAAWCSIGLKWATEMYDLWLLAYVLITVVVSCTMIPKRET